ncbi:MAG: acetylornithine transaminase [Candidatus Dadabacteria bacterium]|nr:MAG: acetylornithine transaminase [Candidatus Dadabacteria bacterium]
MSAKSTIEATDLYTAPNYARYRVAFVRGEGRRLWDESGKVYLDMLAGLGVASLGYGYPSLVEAICDQAGRLLHTSNLYYHQPGAELAARLVELSFADRVFFANSGTEANEAAIKMARRRGGGRYEVVSALRSFHGRTLGALAATGQPQLQEGCGPMPPGFRHVPYGDAGALAEAVGEQTAAVLVEPILGESGVIVPGPGYLRAVREICDRAGALMIVDEVQTGIGRTGRLFAHELEGVRPDICTVAKGLGGGLPIGAVLATEEAASALTPGSHGSTFGANLVCCRAALAVLAALYDDGVLENAERAGAYLGERLERLAAARDDVVEARGVGLMRALELNRPAKPVVERALELGLIVNATAGTVVRMLPPLTITREEIDEGVELLERALG